MQSPSLITRPVVSAAYTYCVQIELSSQTGQTHSSFKFTRSVVDLYGGMLARMPRRACGRWAKLQSAQHYEGTPRPCRRLSMFPMLASTTWYSHRCAVERYRGNACDHHVRLQSSSGERLPPDTASARAMRKGAGKQNHHELQALYIGPDPNPVYSPILVVSSTKTPTRKGGHGPAPFHLRSLSSRGVRGVPGTSSTSRSMNSTADILARPTSLMTASPQALPLECTSASSPRPNRQPPPSPSQVSPTIPSLTPPPKLVIQNLPPQPDIAFLLHRADVHPPRPLETDEHVRVGGRVGEKIAGARGGVVGDQPAGFGSEVRGSRGGPEARPVGDALVVDEDRYA